MQALDRIVLSENFIAILFVVLLSFMTMLTSVNSVKLKKTILVIFNPIYLEEEAESKSSFFSFFNILLVGFTSLIFSLLAFKLLNLFYPDFKTGLVVYGQLTLGFFLYFTLKWLIEYFLSILFLIKNSVHFFIISKSRTLYAISFGLFFLLLVTNYSELSATFLFYSFLFLMTIRFLAIILNNKKLILSKLFYFILYLCALEIAPLFLVYKLMF